MISTALDLRGVDFEKTAAVYNFSFYFDGKRLVLAEPNRAAVVYRDGALLRAVGYGEWTQSELANAVEERLGLGEDYSELFSLAEHDVILARVPAVLAGWRMRSMPLWLALLVAINQQNASFAQGWRNLCRIIKRLGKPARLGDVYTYLPPSPEDVLRRRDELRGCGVGYRAGYILSVAEALAEGRDPLRAKGVGGYTRALAELLAYRRYDEPPVDRWVEALVEKAYGGGDARELLKRRFGRWAGLAVYLYTIVLDAAPLRRALQRIERGLIEPVEEISPMNLWRLSSFC